MSKGECISYIPIGGKGERLRPLTQEVSKPCLPISYRGNKVNRIFSYAHEAAKIVAEKVYFSTYYQALLSRELILKIAPSSSIFIDSGLLHIGGSLIEHWDMLDLNPNINRLVIIPGDHFVTEETIQTLIKVTQKSDIGILASNMIEGHTTLNIDSNNVVLPSSAPDSAISHTVGNLGIYTFSIKWLQSKIKLLSDKKGQRIDLTTDIVFGDSRNKPVIRAHTIDAKENWEDLGTPKALFSHIRSKNHQDESGNTIFPDVYVSSDVVLDNCVVMPGAIIKGNMRLTNAIIGEHTHVTEKVDGLKTYQTHVVDGITLYGPIQRSE